MAAVTRVRVREIRESRGLTQRDLALRAGLAESTLSVLERGHVEPRVGALSKVAQALNVELTELIAV